MKIINISNAFIDLVSTTDKSRENDLLLIINGITSEVSVGVDIKITFNDKVYVTRVLADGTWLLNILNDNLCYLAGGKYIIQASVIEGDVIVAIASYDFYF